MDVIASPRALRILHLEDSLTDHELAALTLRRAGLVEALVRVDTLDEFRDLTEQGAFDLILADYRLPAFTALDAWALLQGLSHRPPFILLSGAIGETAAVDAVRLGIADYLLKDDLVRLPIVIARALEMEAARKAKEKAASELALSQQRLAELTEHLQTSIEKERAAIAREIHDDIGGSLAAIRFDISWIARNTQDTETAAHARSALDMLQHAIGASQRIQMDLRPPILEQGLVAAVEWLARSFERRTGIPTQLRGTMQQPMLDGDIRLVAYRTAQEALTNVSKYAQARHVYIDFSDSGGLLTLEVTDDGVGMDAAQRHKPGSFGLRGLQERARTVGGWLDVSSRPGQGTSLTLCVPLDLHRPSPSKEES